MLLAQVRLQRNWPEPESRARPYRLENCLRRADVDSQKLLPVRRGPKAFTRIYSSISGKTLSSATSFGAKLSNVKLDDGTDISGNVEGIERHDAPTVRRHTAIVSSAARKRYDDSSETRISISRRLHTTECDVLGFNKLDDPSQPPLWRRGLCSGYKRLSFRKSTTRKRHLSCPENSRPSSGTTHKMGMSAFVLGIDEKTEYVVDKISWLNL